MSHTQTNKLIWIESSYNNKNNNNKKNNNKKMLSNLSVGLPSALADLGHHPGPSPPGNNEYKTAWMIHHLTFSQCPSFALLWPNDDKKKSQNKARLTCLKLGLHKVTGANSLCGWFWYKSHFCQLLWEDYWKMEGSFLVKLTFLKSRSLHHNTMNDNSSSKININSNN